MEELGRQTVLIVGVLLCAFVGPVIATIFLTLRKRKARALRRAPVERNLLRGAGESLREQLNDASDDVLWDLVLLQVMPLTVLTVFLAQSLVRGLSNTLPIGVIYAVAAIAFITYSVRKLMKAGARLDKLRAGFDAELAAGQELDQLMRQGAYVFHDFPAENFNIDHIVVSPVGIFAIETKGFSKSRDGDARKNATVIYDGTSLQFPTWTTRAPLLQAERQAAWLTRWISSAAGDPVEVIPVLALPGWFINEVGVGRTIVRSGRQLSNLLHRSTTVELAPDKIRRVVHQIEQRCRTVSPRLGTTTKAQ